MTTVGIAMLSTTGGSSIVAQSLAAALREREIGVRLLHGNPSGQAIAGARTLSPEASLYLQRALDVDLSLCGSMGLCSQMFDWYAQDRFDILHIHNLQVFGLAALMLKRVYGVPFVVTMHGSDVFDERMMHDNLIVAREVLADAAGVSCVSRYLRDALVRQHPELRVEVIYNFLGPAFQSAHGATPDAVPEHRPTVLHVSSLRPVKRPHLLLQSFTALRASRPSAQLRIATTKWGVTRAAALVAGSQVADAVTVVNAADDPPRLHDEYRGASALLHTSRNESFALVLIEALAYGVPVIAPAVGGIPEVLGGDWPFLIESGAQPSAYASALTRALGSAGRQAIETRAAGVLARFGKDAAVDAYLRLYESGLGKRVGGA